MKRLVALLLATAMVLGLCALPVGAQSDKVKVIVSFQQKPGQAEQALIHRFGGIISHAYTIVPAIAATLPAQAVEALQKAPGVLRVEPDVEIHAVGELDNVWGVKQIGSGLVHPYNKGAGVKVAVIDSGIDYTHPDLNANYVSDSGYDWVNRDADPMDDNGHGTHVAGTIAAEADGTGAIGVAPEAKLYALKVLNSSGSGSFSDVIAALEWCVKNGIQVTNNSYGSSIDPGTAVKAAFDNAYAKGIVHVAAAGNSGNKSTSLDNVIYPAKYSSVIAVAATDSRKQRASFSSTGPAVELAAPGVSIYSTVPGGGYASYSGTSMASPHVAGTVALVIASGVIGTEAIRQRLQQTADDLGTTERDWVYGFGLVDADEAAPKPASGVPVVTITSPVNNAEFHIGESITFTGTAYDTEDGDIPTQINWSSNPGGSMGTGASVSKSFDTEGQYVVTASATDTNNNTGSASVTIHVVNDAPVVTILSPADGSPFDSGATVDFSGTASDTEDGDMTTSLVWTSGGETIGTGGSGSWAPPGGTHTITAQTTDSGGKKGSASIQITVGTPAPATYGVASVMYWTEGGKGGTAHLRIGVKIVDGQNNPVSGAVVTVFVTRNGSSYYPGPATTGTDGVAAFKLNNAPSGTYVTEVKSVQVGGVTYYPTTPENQFPK